MSIVSRKFDHLYFRSFRIFMMFFVAFSLFLHNKKGDYSVVIAHTKLYDLYFYRFARFMMFCGPFSSFLCNKRVILCSPWKFSFITHVNQFCKHSKWTFFSLFLPNKNAFFLQQLSGQHSTKIFFRILRVPIFCHIKWAKFLK